MRSHPRGAMRPSCASIFRPENRGRGECRVLDAPMGPVQKKSTGVGPQVHRNHPAFPHADGFNGFLRALPGDRAFLPPSSLRSLLPRNLTPASGRQDHTTSPSAKAFSQKPPGGFGTAPAEALAKADQRRSSHAAVASTASRSNVRDDRETPLSVGRDGGKYGCDLGQARREIFLGEGTGQVASA
jgi:hypothetical protein